jgi:hypothetical protein
MLRSEFSEERLLPDTDSPKQQNVQESGTSLLARCQR